MAFVTVAQLKTTLGLGSLYADADLENITDSADAIIDSFLPHNWHSVVAHALKDNVATLYTLYPHGLIVGQEIEITNCGTVFNGTKTITATTTYSVSYAKTSADQEKHLVVPNGRIAGPENTDWTTYDAICMAALLIAVDIFQAKTAPSGGAVAVDFQPSPYKMGMSLLSRVKGLLAPYMAVGGMIG